MPDTGVRESWRESYESFDARLVREFLKRNGYELVNGPYSGEDHESWSRPPDNRGDMGIGVDVGYEAGDIVFIGHDGDFADVPLNYYALVGFLLEMREISVRYVQVSGREIEQAMATDWDGDESGPHTRKLPPPNIPEE